jgi:G3E family GTPase
MYMIAQVVFADKILLNKCDLVTPEYLDEVCICVYVCLCMCRYVFCVCVHVLTHKLTYTQQVRSGHAREFG